MSFDSEQRTCLIQNYAVHYLVYIRICFFILCSCLDEQCSLSVTVNIFKCDRFTQILAIIIDTLFGLSTEKHKRFWKRYDSLVPHWKNTLWNYWNLKIIVMNVIKYVHMSTCCVLINPNMPTLLGKMSNSHQNDHICFIIIHNDFSQLCWFLKGFMCNRQKNSSSDCVHSKTFQSSPFRNGRQTPSR